MLLVLGISSIGLAGCPTAVDDIVSSIVDECLATNENCDTAYVQGNYDVSSLRCCSSTASCTTAVGDSQLRCRE